MDRLTSSSIANLKKNCSAHQGQAHRLLGDLMLDRYLWGTASRLSPEAAVRL